MKTKRVKTKPKEFETEDGRRAVSFTKTVSSASSLKMRERAKKSMEEAARKKEARIRKLRLALEKKEFDKVKAKFYDYVSPKKVKLTKKKRKRNAKKAWRKRNVDRHTPSGFQIKKTDAGIDASYDSYCNNYSDLTITS